MKNIILICLLLLPFIGFSQSTEILPGTALPQMTTAQRTTLASLVNGMLVFDTNSQSYWYRQSGAWVELPKGGNTSNYWQLDGLGGNEIKNTNSGGLWSANTSGLTSLSNDVSNPATAPVNGGGTRLMWIPSRSAFRVGTISFAKKSWDADSIGLFSFAAGYNTLAKGYSSTSMGYVTAATGHFSTALGHFTNATGNYSTAIGSFSDAIGEYSTAIGNHNVATGDNSIVMGILNMASGYGSIAAGQHSIASASASVAIGAFTDTNGKTGSFTFGDFVSNSADKLTSDLDNRFNARFENGYRLYTDNDLSNATKYGVILNNKDNSWSTISDSTKKERFISYDLEKVLNSVAAMRVGTWNYKGDRRPEGRHWGVMAQDFYHHFGKDEYGTVGSDTLIATADFDGVSFAAIKALELRTRELQEENKKLLATLAAKDEKYMQLFADLKNEIASMKNFASNNDLSAKAKK